MVGIGCKGCGSFEGLNQSQHSAEMGSIFRDGIVDGKKSRHGGDGSQIRMAQSRRIPQDFDRFRHFGAPTHSRAVVLQNDCDRRIEWNRSKVVWNSSCTEFQIRICKFEPANEFGPGALRLRSIFSQWAMPERFAVTGWGCSGPKKGGWKDWDRFGILQKRLKNKWP